MTCLIMDPKDTNPKVVLYGDSVGCNYRLRVRANTYTDLLARRLQKPAALDYISGANSTLVLNCLTSDEVRIGHLKTAEIVVLSVGGNNVLVAFLMAMIRALDLGPIGAKTMKQIAKKFQSDKLAAVKVVKELLGKKTKEDASAGVEIFRKEFPAIIAKIKELNPDAIILVHNVYNPFNAAGSIFYRIMGKPMGKYMTMLNEIIAEAQSESGFILADVDELFNKYKGNQDLTYIKEKDMHLTAFGHISIYTTLYDTLVKHYPRYQCDEAKNVIIREEDLSKEEIEATEKAAALLKAMTEGGDSDAVVQPDDFSSGELEKYNEWFTGEAMGMKFYPLKKVELAVENPDAAKSLEINQSVFFKVEDGSVYVFNQEGVKLGSVADEPVDDNSPSIAFAVENNFPNTAKVFANGEKTEVIYAIYPTYKYYAESVKKNKEQKSK